MPLRQTLQWMLILLATIVIVGGGGVIWLWSRSETMLRQQITERLDQLAPDLSIEFEKASLESDGRVRVTEVSLLAADHGSTLLRLPEILVYPDRDLLVEHRQISIVKVVLNRPQVTLEQSPDGGWSFQGLKLPQPAGMAWPEVNLFDGEVLLRAHRDALVPLEMHLKNLDAHLKPTAKGQCEIKGHGDLDPIGPVEIEGELDTTTGRWNIRGRARRIPAGDKLIGVASELSSSVKSQVQSITQTVREKTRHPALQPPEPQHAGQDRDVRTAALEVVQPDPAAEKSLIPRIGLRADLDLKCEVACKGFGEPINYAADLQIENGEVTDLFPIPLREVSGRVLLTRDRVQIQNLKASNRDSRLTINGELPLGGNPAAPSLELLAVNLPVDRRIRDLTPGLQKLYDLVQPEGRFDIDLVYAPGASPPVILREFRVRDGSLLHDLFRYPVKSITGTVVQDGDKYMFDMRGLASGHEGKMTGFVRGMGTDLEADLRVQSTQGLPIDDVLVAAFDTPKLQSIAATLRQMRVRGEGDFDVSFRLARETGPKFLTFLKANIRNSEVNYVRFPLPLTQVSARIEHNPLKGNIWHFKKLKGTRGETVVSGFGNYETRDGVGQLDLEFDALDVPIDPTLKAACLTATDHLQVVWDQLNPTAGMLEFQKLKILWSPGQSPQVTMPFIQLRGAAIKLAAIPYPLDRVSGTFSWDGEAAVVEHADGWHGSTYVEIVGAADKPPPFFQLSPARGIDWRLHLPEVRVRQVTFDKVLRQALPESIRTTVEQLDPRGPLDLDLALDLKQFRAPEPMVTANFQLDATLKANRINAGVTLEQATGHVALIDGSWDGQLVTAEGYADLDSVKVWDLPLTRLEGPFSVVGNRITAGKPPVGSPQPYSPKNPFAKHEVVASLYEGKISLNAEAILDPQSALNTKYDAEVNIQGAKLELWAREQGSRERLKGPVTGHLAFHGAGSSPLDVEGVGWVQITQATLYELPVLVKVFALPNFRSPDDKAFKYAYSDFQIRRGKFDFTKIELVGDAISLVGRGNVGFAGEEDRQIDFDFYTDARNRVPLLEPLIQRVASRWVWVRVDGTIDDYKAVMQARVPILDDVLRGVMQNIDNGQRQVPPIPPTAATSGPTRR